MEATKPVDRWIIGIGVSLFSLGILYFLITVPFKLMTSVGLILMIGYLFFLLTHIMLLFPLFSIIISASVFTYTYFKGIREHSEIIYLLIRTVIVAIFLLIIYFIIPRLILMLLLNSWDFLGIVEMWKGIEDLPLKELFKNK